MEPMETTFKSAFYEETYPVPRWVRWKHISMGLLHCPICLTLDNCWFAENNAPLSPQHDRCHCALIPIPLSLVIAGATATSDIRKYTEYIFNSNTSKNKGKKRLFESWGYSKADSELLQKEIEQKALEKYKSGEYHIGSLDAFGQRISIQIELYNKSKNNYVLFETGWMIKPNGTIQLTTPYGGKAL